MLKTGTAAALLPRFATTFFGGITTARMAMTDEANSGVCPEEARSTIEQRMMDGILAMAGDS